MKLWPFKSTRAAPPPTPAPLRCKVGDYVTWERGPNRRRVAKIDRAAKTRGLWHVKSIGGALVAYDGWADGVLMEMRFVQGFVRDSALTPIEPDDHRVVTALQAQAGIDEWERRAG